MAVAFPHMMPGDTPLFAAFVLSPEGQRYEAWGFDVKLGTGAGLPGLPANPNQFDLARYLTMLRVDAIGWIGDDPTIFEVKPSARLGAIGQLVTYCWEWRQKYGQSCARAVITDYVNEQSIRNFAAQDIDIYVVEPASEYDIIRATQYVYSLPQRDA